MKNDFTSAAKGMDKEFIFKGYRYRLEADVDVLGDVKALPLALRSTLGREGEMMSHGLQLGDTLDGLIEQFSVKPGDAVYPLVIIEDRKRVNSLANNIWGAAMQVLKREYRPETMILPSKPKQHMFQVLNGGLA